MRTVKVLVLDDTAQGHLPMLHDQGVRFEVIQYGSIAKLTAYQVSEGELEDVASMTERKAVDLVVIGNNTGVGVQKARAVAEAMRPMTVVVWNFYCKGDEEPYAALGFKHFCSRSDLRKIVPTVLGLGQ